MPDKFYRPEKSEIKSQSTSNRQGTSESICDDMTAEQFLTYLDNVEAQYSQYKELLDKGLSREQARIGLPVNIYTEWYWKCDLHNIYRFLSLRMDSHAQKEIRDYANAMYRLVAEICPIATEAFVDYQLEGMYLSRLEVEAIQNKQAKLNINNQRENTEWTEKMNKLGLKFD
jgi:thymidylate synthase (FAD)